MKCQLTDCVGYEALPLQDWSTSSDAKHGWQQCCGIAWKASTQLTDHEVHAWREAVCFCTRVADEARLVQLLCNLHDALSRHVQRLSGLLLHLQGTQRQRRLPLPLLTLHLGGNNSFRKGSSRPCQVGSMRPFQLGST